MTDDNIIPVYAHRDTNGYAYVSFGEDALQYRGDKSATEHVETIMFDAHGDSFWGPSPSEAERMSGSAIRGAGELPVESERGDLLYQVGTVAIDEDRYIVSVVPFDEPKLVLQEEAGWRFDIERGDVFKTDGGPIKVLSVSRHGDYLDVTDPTVDHSQDARYGQWSIERYELEEGLESGSVERGSLEVM